MRKAHAIKAKKVEEIKAKIGESVAVFLTDYQGVKVKEITDLRHRLRKIGSEYRVIKNNLLFRSVQDSQISGLEKYLTGQTAVAFASTDAVASVKIFLDFIKEYKKLTLKAGVLGNKIIGEAEIKDLATLPPKEFLVAQVIGGIKSPLTGLMGVLSGTMRGLVTVLKAIGEKNK